MRSTVDHPAIRGSSSELPADSVFDPVGAASHCLRESGREPCRKKGPRILLKGPSSAVFSVLEVSPFSSRGWVRFRRS